MPMQLTTALRARVVASAAVEPVESEEGHAGHLQGGERDAGHEGPAAEPGGVAAPASEDAASLVRRKSTTPAEVRRQRRMLVAGEVAARPGVDTVPTVEFDMPSVVMVAPKDGSQLADLASPRCG